MNTTSRTEMYGGELWVRTNRNGVYLSVGGVMPVCHRGESRNCLLEDLFLRVHQTYDVSPVFLHPPGEKPTDMYEGAAPKWTTN